MTTLRSLFSRIYRKNNNKIADLYPRFTCDFPSLHKYDIGAFTYGSPEVIDWNQATTLKIGKFCSIAEGVLILLGGEHSLSNITTYPFKTIKQQWEGYEFPFSDDFETDNAVDEHSKGDVIIGNDVWIGRNVLILSGVEIGNGAVVGAGAVVTKNVPPYGIVAGNPARLLRSRFDPETIDYLNELKWWDWSIEKIDRNKSILIGNSIDALKKGANYNY